MVSNKHVENIDAAGSVKKGKGEFLLSGDLTLQNATSIKELFAGALSESGSKVTFHFSDVGDVDLSFVQILCAAHRNAHGKGTEIVFEGEWPSSFRQLINDAGLDDHVGCNTDCSIECPWLNQ